MTRIYAFLAVLAGFAALVVKAFAMGKKSAKQSAEFTKAQAELSAHERLNDVKAPSLNDADNISRLQSVAKVARGNGKR